MDNKFKKEGTAFVLHNEEGDKIAEIHYKETDEDYVIADHTLVDESLRGHGIAEQLLDKCCLEVSREPG